MPSLDRETLLAQTRSNPSTLGDKSAMTVIPPTPDPIKPATSGFDYSRPLSGNLGMYKLLWRASRASRASGPKPHLLARAVRQLWIPWTLLGSSG